MIVEPYKILLPAEERFDWEGCPFEELVSGNCRMMLMDYGRRMSARIRVSTPSNLQLYRLKIAFGRPFQDADDYVALWSNDSVWLSRAARLYAQSWTNPKEPEVVWRWIERNSQAATQ